MEVSEAFEFPFSKKEALGWLGMTEEFHVKKEKMSNALHMLWESTGKLEVSIVMVENWKQRYTFCIKAHSQLGAYSSKE